jgi:membrane-bound lytic murein transglycosylase D
MKPCALIRSGCLDVQSVAFPQVFILLLAAALLSGCQMPARQRGPEKEQSAEPVEWDIPIEMNEAVESWLEYYQTRGRKSFEITLARAGRYEKLMREVLRRKGLPEDLVFLSLIESGFAPEAYSRARAAGLWQFVPATAQIYELEISRWVDERYDPIAATSAAAEYLEDLQREFGDWYLTVAAYNAGPGRVNQAIRRAGSRDFWTLAERRVLRAETRHYVPKLIAAALIAKQPQKYGLRKRPEPIATFDIGHVPDATSLDVVADAAGVPLEDILALNLHLIRGITPPGERYTVRLPAGRPRVFAENYAKVPASERVRSIVHIVRRGENLQRIARRYGARASAIVQTNAIDPDRLFVGQRLVIPGAHVPLGLSD